MLPIPPASDLAAVVVDDDGGGGCLGAGSPGYKCDSILASGLAIRGNVMI